MAIKALTRQLRKRPMYTFRTFLTSFQVKESEDQRVGCENL